MTIGTWLVIIRARANDDPGLSWSTLLISFSFMYFHVLYSTIQRHDPSLPRGVHDSPPCAACWNPDWNPRPWRTQLSTVASVGTMSLWTASDLMKFSRLDLRKICRYLCHKFLGLQLAAPSLWWMLCRIMPLCRPLCHTYCDVFWGVCKSDFAASDSLATCFFVGLPSSISSRCRGGDSTGEPLKANMKKTSWHWNKMKQNLSKVRLKKIASKIKTWNLKLNHFQ